MSSFTDDVMKFNPYISQIPVDDYVKVGMMKQSQYNEGVRTVQGAVDQINSLPVIRDVDKEYLRSAMTKLQQQARSVASGDYSSQQLVNQLTGATRQIASDKNIKAAVSSAMFAQSQNDLIEKQRQEGKSSPSNELDYYEKYQQYVNSTDLGKVFNYQYTPYRDVKKKAIEVLGTLLKNPDVKITDTSFGLDKNGNFVPLDAKLKEALKGVSPDKIKAALLASFDEGDLKQLSIDGRYSLANKDPKAIATIAQNSIDRQRNFLQTRIKTLQGTKQGVADKSQLSQIDQNIQDLQKELKGVDNQEKSYLDMLQSGDLDTLKANLYTSDFLNQFGNAFSFSEISQTYETNPAAEIAMQRERLNQEWARWSADYEQKERFHKEDLAQKKKDDPGDPSGLGGVPETVDISKVPEVNLQNFKDHTQELENGMIQKEQTLLKQHGQDENWLHQQKILYDQGKELEPSLKLFFKDQADTQKEIETNKWLMLQLTQEADKNIGSVSKFFDNSQVTTYIPDKNNPDKKFSYTQQELYDAYQGFAQYVTVDTHDPDNPVVRINKEELNRVATTEKQKIFLKAWLADQEGKSLSPGQKELMSITRGIVKSQAEGVIELTKKRNAFINQELAKRTGETQRTAYEIPAGKPGLRSEARTVVNNFISRAEDQGSFGTDTNRANISEIEDMNDDEKATYSLVVKGKTQFGEAKYWIRLKNKANKTNDIPLSPEDKFKIFGAAYEDQAGQGVVSFREQYLKTANGSTNINGTSDPVKAYNTAYFSQKDFPQVKNFTVRADSWDQGNGNLMVLYIYDPLLSKSFVRKEYTPRDAQGNYVPMDDALVQQAPQGLTDAMIFQILYGHAPTDEEMKKIENLNKNAFN